MLCDRYFKEIEFRIAKDKERGASQLYLEALRIVKKWLEEHVLDEDCFRKLLARLVKGQPSMAPMLNLANNLLLALEEGWDRVREFVEAELEGYERKMEAVVECALAQLSSYGRFATTSYSSTLLHLFRRLGAERKALLFVARGAPVPYGLRLADGLKEWVETVITTDALLPFVVRKVDAVVVGADSVDENGVVNGAGTFSLALAARWFEKPFYVVCSTEKFLPSLLSRYHVVREEEYPEELSSGHRVEYHIFDVTPVELVTGFITERGFMGLEDFLEYQRGLRVSEQFHSIMEL